MNIILTIPKNKVKVVGNRATISVSQNKLEKAFRDAEQKAWEQAILARAKKIDPKNPSKNTVSWEEIKKARAQK